MKDRKAEWRQYYYDKLVELTPSQIAEMRAEKALYDKWYRDKNRENRRKYKADPERMKRWNELRRERYQKERAHPRKVMTPEQAREAMRESWRKYYRKNKAKRLAFVKTWAKGRRKSDPVFRLRWNISRRVNYLLRGIGKSARTVELLGCSVQELREHLEKQFKPGMTWENHSRNGWHIDHIKPCSSFNLADPEEQKRCFNYKNLQPLWMIENMKKGDKIPA